MKWFQRFTVKSRTLVTPLYQAPLNADPPTLPSPAVASSARGGARDAVSSRRVSGRRRYVVVEPGGSPPRTMAEVEHAAGKPSEVAGVSQEQLGLALRLAPG